MQKNVEVCSSLLDRMDCSVLDLVGHWWLAWERLLVEMSMLAWEESTLSLLMTVLEILTMAWEILTLWVTGMSTVLWKLALETPALDKLEKLTW